MTKTSSQFKKEFQQGLAGSDYKMFRIVLLIDGELFYSVQKHSVKGITKFVENFDVASFPYIYAVQGKGLLDLDWDNFVYGPAE